MAACQNLTFTEPTMVAEWGLVCDRNWQSKVENTSTIIEVQSFNSTSSLYINTIEGHHVNPDVWLHRFVCIILLSLVDVQMEKPFYLLL